MVELGAGIDSSGETDSTDEETQTRDRFQRDDPLSGGTETDSSTPDESPDTSDDTTGTRDPVQRDDPLSGGSGSDTSTPDDSPDTREDSTDTADRFQRDDPLSGGTETDSSTPDDMPDTPSGTPSEDSDTGVVEERKEATQQLEEQFQQEQQEKAEQLTNEDAAAGLQGTESSFTTEPVGQGPTTQQTTTGIGAGITSEEGIEQTSQAIRDTATARAEEFDNAEAFQLQQEEARTLRRATRAGGFLSESQEGYVANLSRRLTQDLDFETEIEGALEPTFGSGVSGFVGGFGRIPGGLAGGGVAAINLGESTIESGQSVATGDVGVGELGESLVGAGGEVGEAIAKEFEQDPASASGALVGEVLLGTAALKGFEKAGDVSRGLRIKAGADRPEVSLKDITDETGASGDLPQFDTDPSGPTSEAVEEISQKAADNPSDIAPGDSESAIFHTTGESLPDDLMVEEGASELPGLFGSPDASPIGLQGVGGGYRVSLRPRAPDVRKSDEVVSLPGDDVRGMPESATGAGYELRTPDGEVVTRGLGRGQAKGMAEGTDLDVRPQSDTPGYEFLTEQAEPGTAQVRPSGSRTSELEAIFPPGSEFVEEGVTPVRIGGIDVPGTDTRIPGTGRLVPGRRFRRADSGDGPDIDADDFDADAPDEVIDVPTSDIDFRSGQPYSPPFSFGIGFRGSSGGTGIDDSSLTSGPSESDVLDSLGPGGPSSGGGSATDTPTAPPTFPPSGSGSGSPTPTGTPTFPPSGPGGSSGTPTGSSGSPTPSGSGSSTGSGSSAPPFITTPPGSGKNRYDLPEFDADSDADMAAMFGERGEVFTDFVDPLTGDVIKTER